jgi:hypothetical protein
VTPAIDKEAIFRDAMQKSGSYMRSPPPAPAAAPAEPGVAQPGW